MAIEEGLKLKPTFSVPYHYGKIGVEIPNVGRDDFPKFLFDRGYRVGVEVGVFDGKYGVTLCKAGLKMYGVDPYVHYDEYKVGDENHYEEAVKNLKGYDYKIIKKFSMDALDDFEDGSLDFVYIDANHTLPYITEDIFGWAHKVRVGGIISGHDYCFTKVSGARKNTIDLDGVHVKGAVDLCAYIMRVDRLYILGKKTEKVRDKWRSWFWIKNIG